MKIEKHLFALVCVVAIFATTSCVDERYDLDNVSEDIHLFENGISMPLLKTGDLFFEDLISSEDQIVVNEMGVYEFGTEEDVLSVEVQAVDKVRIPEQTPDFGTLKSESFPFPSGTVRVALPDFITNYEANLHTETDPIDSRVKNIEKVYTHDDWVSTIKLLVLDGTGAPISDASDLKVDIIEFKDYRLELPTVLILDKQGISVSGNVTVTTEDDSNVLILNGEVAASELSIYVKLKGFEIGSKTFVNNKIVVDEDVTVNGDITLTVSNSKNFVYQALGIKPMLHIPEVYMDEVLGSLGVEDEMDPELVDMGTLPDFLESPETSLLLTNPYVPIAIETTIPMDVIYADIVLVPRNENGGYIYDDNGKKIEIRIDHMAVPGDDHNTPGATITYEYVACQRIPELDNLGYIFVECPELGMITKEIPSFIEISGRGYTDPDITYDFYMGEEFYAKLNYEVRVPFMVEANTCIVYEDETTDLNADLFESISVSTIYVNAEILNGFPADMTLEVEPFDVYGNRIDGIEVIIPESIKASETTELTENVVPAKTNIRMEIHELLEGEMQKIDQLKWRVKVLFPDKGLISKYQTLNMKIGLELPEGIGINMDNL